jgi:hypothetical protein
MNSGLERGQRMTRRAFLALFAWVAVIARSLKATQVLHMRENAGPPNTFSGRVVTDWLADGRRMRLLEEFAYFDDAGRRWNAPKGSIVDGASIPRVAWSFIGGPFEGPYRDASVIHDVACQLRLAPWLLVHEVFYSAMLASKVPVLKAKIMYGAVYHFGPRWIPPVFAKDPRSKADDLGPAQPARTQQNFDEMRKRIESGSKAENITLDDIRQLFPPRK